MIELGAFGEYLRGKKTLHSEELVLLSIVALLSPPLLPGWLPRLLITDF